MKHRSLVIGTLFILSPLLASAATPTLYFPLDEGSGTSSNPSVGSGQALIQGGAGWVSGKSGTAIGFDGKNGEVVALGENIIPQGTEGSISLWVEANTLSNNNFFFSARSPSDDKIFWSLGTDYEGRLILRTRAGAGSSAQKVDSSAIFDKSTWYHVVISANALKYSVYVNGEEVLVTGANTGKWVSDFTTGNLRYTLGALDASDFTGVLDGVVDDVRIFGTALTLDDARALYNETNQKGPSIPAGATPQISFTSSGEAVPFGGSIHLTWNVTNANSCTASWETAPIALTGSVTFTKLATDSSYTITCTKTGGVPSSATINAHVLPQGATTTPTTLTQVPVTEIILGSGPTLSKTLMIGSRGADVTVLQEYLIKKGYLSVKATGYFGVMTKAAVTAFQKANGLDPVGIAGPKTRTKIGAMP